MNDRSAIVIGAGVAGLATARALAVRGYKVTVIERNEKAIGASIRNFGMIWPIGQPDGELYEAAMSSRSIWKQICDEAGIWYDQAGSLHVAYSNDEFRVLEELTGIYNERGYSILNPDEISKRSPVIIQKNLIGGLYSDQELIVDPRIAVAKIPAWLSEKYKIDFLWHRTVTDICYPAVFIGNESFEADEIFLCSGADFETLYPQVYGTLPLTKCKLQMMRMINQSQGIGPSLCGALSLTHYASFKAAATLTDLKKRFEEELPEYLKWGIHVMVSQNQEGELAIGDSHEYGLTHDPFDRHFINQLILDYLKKFARFENEVITETWNGIYPKLTDGSNYLVLEPESGVTIINGFGGAGMTLSFGFCEQLFTKRKTLTFSTVD
jgi:FAD dependent oxidoreductase TIGR03364